MASKQITIDTPIMHIKMDVDIEEKNSIYLVHFPRFGHRVMITGIILDRIKRFPFKFSFYLDITVRFWNEGL